MKLTLFSAWLVLASLPASAQAQDNAVQKGRNSIQLMLRNGSTVTGNILYMSPDGKIIEMQTTTGSEPVWFNDVTSVRRNRENKGWKKRPDPWAFQQRYDPQWKDPSRWEFGFYGDYALGVKKNGRDYFEAGLNVRYGIKEYLFVGGGVGINSIPDFGSTGCAVFGNVRGYFRNHGVRPFADLRVGYNFAMTTYQDERSATFSDKGFLLRAAAGIAIVDRSDIMYSLSAGYQMQSTLLTVPGQYPARHTLGAVGIQLGLTFRW